MVFVFIIDENHKWMTSEKRKMMRKVKVEGFTLIELGIGIALIGMILMIALPPVHSFLRGLQVESSAREIRGDLVFAHQRAVATHNTFQFITHNDNKGYEIRNVDQNRVVITRPLSSSLTFDETSDREISFYHNGNTTGGWVRLRKHDGSRRTQIGIALTGHVFVDLRGW